MSRTKDANGDNHSPSAAPPAAGSRGRQTAEGARSKSSSEGERRGGGTMQGTPLQLPPIDCILLKEEEEVEAEMDEKAKQQLIKETMEAYREDYLNEHCERKMLWEEVNSLRQQVHLLLSELSTARQRVASQSDKLDILQKQRNELISMLQEYRKEDAVDSEGEKRRKFKAASLPSSNDGDSQSPWLCLICTYENPCERLACCEVCGSIRSWDDEMPNSSLAKAGELEPDQVKSKRRKCGKPGEHQWPTAYMQWTPKTIEHRNSLNRSVFIL